MSNNSFETINKEIVKIIEDNKATEIKIVDLTAKSTLANTIIIASTNSTRHSSSLADKLVVEMKNNHQVRSSGVEGAQDGNWVIIDFDFTIVHLFIPEVREYYQFDKLWA